MPVYEFQCAKGHVIEDLVPMGTKTIFCHVCAVAPINEAATATRILSATRTDFEFADNRKHKGWTA